MKEEERWYYAIFVSKMAGGIIMPLVPLFVIIVLDMSIEAVTIATISYVVAQFPAFVMWGDLVDKKGKRRPPMIIGMAVSAIGISIMAFSQNLWTLVAGSVIYGFFIAGTIPSSSMLVMEHSPKEKWGEALGRFTRIGDVGWTIGMAIGVPFFAILPTYLGTETSMRLLFGICVALSIVSWVLAALLVKEPHVKLDRAQFIKELHTFSHTLKTWATARARHHPHVFVHHVRLKHISRARKKDKGWNVQFDIYLVATLIIFAGMEVFFTPFPVMMAEEMGLSDTAIFLVFLTASFVTVLTYAWAGRFVDRKGNKRSQLTSWGLVSLVFPLAIISLLLSSSEYSLMALIVLLGFMGLLGMMFTVITIAGTTTATELVPENIRGEALGAYNAMMGLGVIIGGSFGGVIGVVLGYYWINAIAFLTCIAAVIILLKVKAS